MVRIVLALSLTLGTCTKRSGFEKVPPGVALLRTPWFDDAWQYRQAVLIDGAAVIGEHQDFPVLVHLRALGASFFGGLSSQNGRDGGDIRIADADGTTLLPFELVQLDVNAQNGYLHFRIPQLTAGEDRAFYVYYGNAAASAVSPSASNGREAVWSNGYAGVWHLGDGGPVGMPSHVDSTINRNHGTPLGFDGTATSSMSATGPIGPANMFDGTNDVIDMGSPTALDDLGPMTVSVWIRADASIATGPDILGKQGTGGRWKFEFDNSAPESLALEFAKEFDSGEQEFLSADGTLRTGAWQHAAATWDGTGAASSVHLYLDGAEPAYGSTTPQPGVPQSDASFPLYVGAVNAAGADGFTGGIAEVRLSNVARNADWMATVHANQSNPAVGGFWKFITGRQARP